MEDTLLPFTLADFKPICNRAHGQLDVLLAHTCTAPLMPFLFCINPSSYGDLHVVVSDFHSNTWHASFDYEYLENLRNELGMNDCFPAYIQTLHDGFSSNRVKFELGGSPQALSGTSSAKLKTTIAMDTVREISLELEPSQGKCANDNMSTLIWELFDSLSAAKSQILHLEAALQEGKIKTLKVMDAVECIREKQKAMAINVSPMNPARKQSRPSVQVMTTTSKFPRSSSAGNCLLGANSPSTGFKIEETYCPGDEIAAAVSGIGSQVMETMSENEGFVPPMDMQQHIEAESEINAMREAKNRSLCSDLWARRHYLEWRKEQGLPASQIEDLPLTEVADSLVKFFYMVKKRNGSLFPSESLRAMFRAFGRILRSHYKKLQSQGKYDGPIVDLSRDPLFEKSRLACLEAMKYSKMHGGNIKRRKKPDEWIPAPEEDILCHPANQVTDPYGLLKRLCFYVIHKFHVYGHMELYYTTDIEFQRIVSDDGTSCWEYNEKRAANHKRKSSFRDPVRCSESDVVLCLDKYFFHAPPKAIQDEPRQLFLAPIGKPVSNVWYRDQIMNLKTLRGWYRYMGPMPGRADSDPQLSSSQMDVFYNNVDPNLDAAGTLAAAAAAAAAFITTPKGFHNSIGFDRNDNMACESEEAYDGFEANMNDELTDNELDGL